MNWHQIVPNSKGDWINQRNAEFSTWPVLAEKSATSIRFFELNTAGIATSRDPWCYNESQELLSKNMHLTIDAYNAEVERLTELVNSGVPESEAREAREVDSTKFKWDRVNVRNVVRGKLLRFSKDNIRVASYRPFMKQNVYFDSSQQLNNCTYQLKQVFPLGNTRNIGIYAIGVGGTADFSILSTELIFDVQYLGAGQNGQFFPRFTWQQVDGEVEGALFGEGIGKQGSGESSIYGEIGEYVDGYVRVDNVTNEIKKLYRDALGSDITGDDIFHFVYGKLHDPAYRTTYAADLKKMLPHIETPATREEFDKFATAGKQLMDLHVNYEDVKPWPVTITVKGDEADRETWRVTKLKWAKVKDPETGKNVNDVTKMIYNNKVTISDIPAEADEYMLGSRSALAWIIDRYQVKKDKASGIVNDPNDWADEVDNPRYIADLIAKVTRVAVETMEIVNGLEA